MEKKYKTGEFAKLANVTERTLRYYDKIGLLKPSFILSNGYRQYTDSDLLKLQKILSLKYLGFSIEEIFPIMLEDQNLIQSFKMQIDLIDSRIKSMTNIKDSMESIISTINDKNIDWSKIISLIKMSSNDSNIIEHYKNTKNLNVRISLHDKYSQNKQGWFPWLFEQIDFSRINRLLEVGCGNGKLWKNNKIDLRNREIFLSDSSQGMVEEVRKTLGNDFNCMVFSCEQIPFKDDYFDTVIANHVLFYVYDLDLTLKEITRVLNKSGMLYCSTYGSNHMKEINDLVLNFDSRVRLSQTKLYDVFGLDNGEYILRKFFKNVYKKKYKDCLIVDKSKPIIDYIMSCHGNQNELLGPKLDEFRKYLDSILLKEGAIKITKEAGIFVCLK
ncbi:MerR family transcriptional regulator [Faecalitalea cylindroides]|uniref:MerR family transcriptional regulator n=1 Tax=Faecalitalea cylindroides TaxID=39483 RepID=UPI001896C6A9|nr:MerR family transcriptional regulator [Faecalitalea cylindroides]MDB7947534.1 MerR family transcriptional regulator [Faecalitalea cylindroides]MDB7949402.1 MerR family transcriptional regulator [Faecalitalea cylindroides]MDB7951268.1 MerR family transcriptional regulator [Faecalitalea cylindroides]